MTSDLTVSRPLAFIKGAMPMRIIIDAQPSGCAVCQKEPDPYHRMKIKHAQRAITESARSLTTRPRTAVEAARKARSSSRIPHRFLPNNHCASA